MILLIGNILIILFLLIMVSSICENRNIINKKAVDIRNNKNNR